MLTQHYQRLNRLILILFILLTTACSSIISSTASNMAANLSYTILNSDDPQTVAEGAPAYLLLMDSFLIDSDNNIALLQSAATLYGAYASIFVTDDAQRSIKMSNKALSYAEQALCLDNKKVCHLRDMNFTEFSLLTDNINKNNSHSWYILGSSWAGWIKANSASMSAVAQLPKVTLIMSRILAVDENYQEGQVHLYLGVLKTLLPPALGGKPEIARQHFEQAIAISHNKNLMAKVLYAEKYCRLVFNQDLHDQLLNEVLQADPYSENLTLMNVLAQAHAQKLLDSSPEYF